MARNRNDKSGVVETMTVHDAFCSSAYYFHSHNTIAMPRVAFKMKLFPGHEAEYKKRHDEIWPELQALLKDQGISEYSIFLDETTNSLFGFLKITDENNLKNLPGTEVMQRWWSYMADIMESNDDHSPVSIPLREVFYLP
jgi:L-rhamnose mutarotase